METLMFINPNPMHFSFNPNEIAADGEPTGPDAGTEPGTTPGTDPMPTYLTPEALLKYCQTRLHSLDSQIQEGVLQQQSANDDQQALSGVQSALSKYADGCTDAKSVQELADAVQQAITNIHDRNPNSPAIPMLQKMLTAIGTGKTTPDLSTQVAMQFEKGAGISVSPPNALSGEQIKDLTTNLGQITSTENSSSEINMINLQSLMSQRQTAVELTTNMVQTLDDTLNKVVSNVGR
jgi:hypothetical protein